MKFRAALSLLLALALSFFCGAVAVRAAVKATIGPNIPGLGYVVFSQDADGSIHVQQDPGAVSLTGRTAHVFYGTVNSQPVYAYVRVSKASNGLFVDLVMDESVSTLSTRLGALDLATVTSSAHPAPTDDAVDSAIITAAGG